MNKNKKGQQCTLCNGTGTIDMHVSVPFSNGEFFEDYKEPCPACKR